MTAIDQNNEAPQGGDPIEATEGRWILQILLCLNEGEHRFSDLRAAIPRVSAKILTDRLRALECAGLVERTHLPAPHSSQVYVLAECGAGLIAALDALARWRGDASRPPDAVRIIDALDSHHYERKKNVRHAPRTTPPPSRKK